MISIKISAALALIRPWCWAAGSGRKPRARPGRRAATTSFSTLIVWNRFAIPVQFDMTAQDARSILAPTTNPSPINRSASSCAAYND
jgi:hypothetical protein